MVTLVWTWPLALHLRDAFAPDLGDPLLNTWILAWNFRQFEGGPESYWDANIFYPARGALGFSEHLLSLAVLLYPVHRFTGNLVATYNLGFLLSFVIAGAGAFALARWYLERTAAPRQERNELAVVLAAWAAGIFFAFSPYRVAELPHLQVLWAGFFPITLYAMERYLERPRARWLYCAAAAALALALANTYFALFGGLFLALFVALRAGSQWRRLAAEVRPVHLLHMLIILAAAVSLLAPIAHKYALLQAEFGIHRSLDEVSFFSARVSDLFRTSSALRLWGPMLGTEDAYPSRQLFPGLTTAFFALLGVWALRADRGVELVAETERKHAGWFRGAARWVGHSWGFVVTALVASLFLAMGPLLDRWLICRFVPECTSYLPRTWWLQTVVPIASGIRVPTRVMALGWLFLAILAGRGVLHLLDRQRSRGWVFALAGLTTVGALADAWVAPISLNATITHQPLPEVNELFARDPTELEARLKAMAPGTPVLHLPMKRQLTLLHMLRSTHHWQPLVNGFSGFEPLDYDLLVQATADFPDERSLDALEERRIEWVVLHPEHLSEEGRFRLRRMLRGDARHHQPGNRLGFSGRFKDGLLFRVGAPPTPKEPG
jgi:hypothetical protein